MDETLRAIDTVSMNLADGTEAKFLLSRGGIRRLKQRFGVKDLKELAGVNDEEATDAILWEALLNKGTMTEAEFLDKVPADIVGNGRAVARLFGASLPEAANGNGDRPTIASEPPSS